MIQKKLVVGKMCMPCKQLKEWLDEKHIELDTVIGEDNLQFCRTYGVATTPSLVIIVDADAPSSYDTYKVIAGKDQIIEYLEGCTSCEQQENA